MAHLLLTRVGWPPHATYGVLATPDGVPFALTLEREDDNNRASTPTRAGACIPTGIYPCRRVMSPKFGDTFEVTGVPGRSHILFHKGNLEDDSRGCILVGEQFGLLAGRPGIIASREGFGEFLERQRGTDGFTLTIRDAT